VAVQNTCGALLSFYLLYRFDASRHDGRRCTNVPQPGLCQEYVQLRGAAADPAGGALAPAGSVLAGLPTEAQAAYPSAGPTAWLILEDTDSYALPASYDPDAPAGGQLAYADVANQPCAAGAPGCLPKFEVRSRRPGAEGGRRPGTAAAASRLPHGAAHGPCGVLGQPSARHCRAS
jgi:hypothetical protein